MAIAIAISAGSNAQNNSARYANWPSRPIQVLTLEDVIAVQKSAQRTNKPTKPTRVAAVSAPEATITEADSDDEDDDFAYTPVTGPVAAVFTTVVGALGTDDEDTWSSEYVPQLIPLPSLIPTWSGLCASLLHPILMMCAR